MAGRVSKYGQRGIQSSMFWKQMRICQPLPQLFKVGWLVDQQVRHRIFRRHFDWVIPVTLGTIWVSLRVWWVHRCTLNYFCTSVQTVHSNFQTLISVYSKILKVIFKIFFLSTSIIPTWEISRPHHLRDQTHNLPCYLKALSWYYISKRSVGRSGHRFLSSSCVHRLWRNEKTSM